MGRDELGQIGVRVGRHNGLFALSVSVSLVSERPSKPDRFHCIPQVETRSAIRVLPLFELLARFGFDLFALVGDSLAEDSCLDLICEFLGSLLM